MTKPSVSLGVIVAPGLARDVTARIAEDLAAALEREHPTIDWKTELVVDRLVERPAQTGDILEAARDMLLERDWDLAVVVTDLPLRKGRRPVTRRVSPAYGVALVSLPALGAVNLRHRLHQTLLDLVRDLAADNAVEELAVETPERHGLLRPLYWAAVILGNLRLLMGMLRANRPWRLAVRLYGALAAALAGGALGVVTADVWRVSAPMEWWRLAVVCVLAIVATVFAVIAAHHLWERSRDRRVREQVALFNIVTAATVTIGIVTLYAALFVLILAGAELVVKPHVFAYALGRDATFTEYVKLAWFVASLATVAGGLGAGLESEEAVREAAYATTPTEDNEDA
jgi:small basic protein